MSTKVISSRITLTQYQEILLECDRLELSVADWIQLQIARSKKWELAKNEISAKLRVIKVTAKIFAKSDRVEEKIQNLMTYIHTML